LGIICFIARECGKHKEERRKRNDNGSQHIPVTLTTHHIYVTVLLGEQKRKEQKEHCV